jgi:GNAT superfamily N-acetyltransferase
MIIYSSKPDLDEGINYFSLSEKTPYSFFIKDDYVLDLTFKGNIKFYEYEVDDHELSQWMKNNPNPSCTEEAREILITRKIDAAIFANDVIVTFNNRYLCKKAESNDLSKMKIEIFSMDDFLDHFKNQDFARFKYTQDLFSCSWIQRKNFVYFVTASIEGYLVGLSKVMEAVESRDEAPIIATSFVSVDPEFQSLGIGSQMKEKIFELAKSLDVELLATDYSVLGYERLRELNWKLASKHGVKFSDGDTRRIQEEEAGLGRKMTEEELKAFIEKRKGFAS